jgi:hypothetical protein
MRFTVTACIRGSLYETDEFQTNNIQAAMRVFDSFAVAAQSISIYDHVQLWETVGSEDIIVEDYKAWNDTLKRAPRFNELLAEQYPRARL